MPPRRRPALRPLPPDLTGPVRAFTDRLREVYWERTEFNQRELGAALHLTKSPISRYLNGQEVMPAAALDQLCTLAHLTTPERDVLRTLRQQAEAALSDDTAQPAPTDEPAAAPRAGFRRVALWAIPAVALLAAGGVTLVLVNSGGAPGPTQSGAPDCRQARQYSVTADGDVLDDHHNDIGDVHRGDVFTKDTPRSNPYPSRYYGHIDGQTVTGFVDQAKLKYLRTVCA